jgi:mRNA interferase RelE/StbE
VPYEVRLSRRAEKQLDRIPEREAERITESILALRAEPRPPDTLKLRGRAPLWRIRTGQYRIVYSIFDPDETVIVDYILRRTSRTYKDLR